MAKKARLDNVEPPAIDINWRADIKNRIQGFDERSKARFLAVYEQTGRMYYSAHAAGVCGETVRNHIKKDPDFKEAVIHARERYRDKIYETFFKLAVTGIEEPIIGGKDRDEIVAKKRIYATNLLAMEMKRLDPDYKERSEVEHKGIGAPLVIPGGMTMTEWIEKYSQKPEHIKAREERKQQAVKSSDKS